MRTGFARRSEVVSLRTHTIVSTALSAHRTNDAIGKTLGTTCDTQVKITDAGMDSPELEFEIVEV
jgi:hypothetical protein